MGFRKGQYWFDPKAHLQLDHLTVHQDTSLQYLFPARSNNNVWEEKTAAAEVPVRGVGPQIHFTFVVLQPDRPSKSNKTGNMQFTQWLTPALMINPGGESLGFYTAKNMIFGYIPNLFAPDENYHHIFAGRYN